MKGKKLNFVTKSLIYQNIAKETIKFAVLFKQNSIYHFRLAIGLMFAFTAAKSEAQCYGGGVSFSFQRENNGIRFYANGSNAALINYDFGDGQTKSTFNSINGTYHAYNQNGKYVVTMYYYDTFQKCRDTVVKSVCNYLLGDSVKIFKSRDTIHFSAPFHAHAAYLWYYGDNTLGYQHKTWKIYPKSDFYNVRLIQVIDTITGCYYDNTPNQFKLIDMTKCGYRAVFYSNTNPLPLIAVVNAYPFAQYNTTLRKPGTETWYWGDGTTSTNSEIKQYKDTHFYASAGVYNICHAYLDTSNCFDSSCSLVKVDPCNAQADFTYTVNKREVSFNYQVKGKSSWYANGKKFNLTQNKYTFTYNGYYDICLESIGDNNCIVKTCKTVKIFDCTPLDSNLVEIKYLNECGSFKFKYKDSLFQKLEWIFDDSSTSSEKEPQYTINSIKNGYYPVTLKALDTLENCSQSVQFYIYKYCCNIHLSMEIDTTSAQTATIKNNSYLDDTSQLVHKHKWIVNYNTEYLTRDINHTIKDDDYIYLIYVAYDAIRNCTDTFRYYANLDISTQLPYRINGGSSDISNELVLKSENVYPVPFGQTIHIAGINEPVMSIKLYDILGQEIPIIWQNTDSHYVLQIKDISGTGLYVLTVQTEHGTYSLKVMRE